MHIIMGNSAVTLNIQTGLITLFLMLIPFIETKGQDNIADLTLDELAHVDIEKKTIGILNHESYSPIDIHLGLLVPYSKLKEYALEVKNAAELAIDEINRSGGVLGKKLNLITADDGAYKELAVSYADTLIKKYKVAAIIGPAGSARVIHLAQTYLPNNPMLLISPSASSSEISDLDDGDLVWRTMTSDALQTKIAANYIVNNLKKKSVGIIYVQDAYGKGLRDEFKKHFKGALLSEVGYSPLVNLNTFDFEEKLQTLFKGKPEAVFFAAGSMDAANIINSIHSGKHVNKKYRPLFFGVDATKSTSLTDYGHKKLIEGMLGTSLKNNNSNQFRHKYYERYRQYPVLSDSERAYDIVYLLSLAMEKAKSHHYWDIKNALRSITEGSEKISPENFATVRTKLNTKEGIHYEGISGKIKFDANGDLANGTFEIWKIKKRKYITVDLVSFAD